ncbi:MAG: hypothetical protein EA376_14340 [Phycisphaeraceae bacterium]|nr:MAG: hypothetical protein EA376_14340 [Phycisphaeraceae bacterium]
MAQRRHHYEQAFESFMRSRRIPYISVNEARRTLLPPAGGRCCPAADACADDPGAPGRNLKSFDFVVYGARRNLLLDIKGRKIPRRRGSRPLEPGRLENWVSRSDVDSLQAWQVLFGPGFEAGFVFVYWCEAQPPDGLFQEVFERNGRWYVLRAVRLEAYLPVMRPRSERWRTVDVPRAIFERISEPFGAAGAT